MERKVHSGQCLHLYMRRQTALQQPAIQAEMREQCQSKSKPETNFFGLFGTYLPGRLKQNFPIVSYYLLAFSI